MGFLPKHVKRDREQRRLRVIALAVLHGFVAIKHRKGQLIADGTPTWSRTTWEARWPFPNDVMSHDYLPGYFYGRARPAAMYLEKYVHGKH